MKIPKRARCSYHPDAAIRSDSPRKRVFECGCYYAIEWGHLTFTAGVDERQEPRDASPKSHHPVTKQDDSDETEGRKLYRGIANTTANFQMNLGRVKYGKRRK